jgi:3-oxoacyl-[acyl-carrier-protein] synthase II
LSGVVITGVGAVTALGDDARSTFGRIVAGECGFRDVTLFDPGPEVRTRRVAEVPRRFESGDGSGLSRTSELALSAAREALRDAGLDRRVPGEGPRVGLVVGGTTAGMFETESFLATLHSSEASRDAAASFLRRRRALSKMLSHPLSAPTDRLVHELGPFVRARSLSSACSSGANALAVGASWLELGLADVVLCGGADSLCRVTFSGFHSLQAMDPAGARPFDGRRRGLTLGEGAGFVVLERAADAARGGRRAICALLGWASRSEAHHVTNPEPDGRAPLEAIRAALERARLSPADIDYVNAHGTGTPLNDAMEARVLSNLFGAEGVARVPVSSQKGMIGHTLAAAGAVESVITALAISRSCVPPTGGLEEPDPACPLLHVRRAESRPIRAAITSSFGFGGMDTALVLAAANHAGHVARGAPSRRTVVVTGVAALTPRGLFTGDAVADLPPCGAAVDVPADVLALDASLSRRLDRTSTMAVVLAREATGSLSSSGGLVLGVAFGAVDATAAYMRRLIDKGPRLVRPADFPGLVPSSPAGQTSIYLGQKGPAMVVADLAASGEAAFVQAVELVASNMADRVCAAAVEERSAIVEEVLSVVFGGASSGPRREGGAALALAAEGPGVRAIARLGEIVVWHDPDGSGSERLPPPPGAGAIVVLSGISERAHEVVSESSWREVPRLSLAAADACGAHEAAGAVAIAVAVAKVARGDAAAALFVGSARGWGYAGTVWSPDP